MLSENKFLGSPLLKKTDGQPYPIRHIQVSMKYNFGLDAMNNPRKSISGDTQILKSLFRFKEDIRAGGPEVLKIEVFLSRIGYNDEENMYIQKISESQNMKMRQKDGRSRQEILRY